MAIELKITWEGEAPGVPQHRLSVAAFGHALNYLLAAYRRIASNMLGDAAAGYAERGRLRDLATLLDIEIEEIVGNSVGVSAVFTYQEPPDAQANLFARGIPERAGAQLLEAIQNEGAGRPYNSAVRKYLGALPPRLTRQRYELNSNGQALHAPVVIEQVNLAEAVLVDLPHIVEFVGSVIGVGFEPGISEVRVKTEDNETLRLLASREQVERALVLRGGAIKGVAVKGKDARLLRLHAADRAAFVLTDQFIEQHIFQRWDVLLRRLAQ